MSLPDFSRRPGAAPDGTPTPRSPFETYRGSRPHGSPSSGSGDDGLDLGRLDSGETIHVDACSEMDVTPTAPAASPSPPAGGDKTIKPRFGLRIRMDGVIYVLLFFTGTLAVRLLAIIFASAATGGGQVIAKFVAAGLWSELVVLTCLLLVVGRAMYSSGFIGTASMEDEKAKNLRGLLRLIAWTSGLGIVFCLLLLLADWDLNLVLAPTTFALFVFGLLLQGQQQATPKSFINIQFFIQTSAVLAIVNLVMAWVQTLPGL